MNSGEGICFEEEIKTVLTSGFGHFSDAPNSIPKCNHCDKKWLQLNMTDTHCEFQEHATILISSYKLKAI